MEPSRTQASFLTPPHEHEKKTIRHIITRMHGTWVGSPCGGPARSPGLGKPARRWRSWRRAGAWRSPPGWRSVDQRDTKPSPVCRVSSGSTPHRGQRQPSTAGGHVGRHGWGRNVCACAGSGFITGAPAALIKLAQRKYISRCGHASLRVLHGEEEQLLAPRGGHAYDAPATRRSTLRGFCCSFSFFFLFSFGFRHYRCCPSLMRVCTWST